MAAGSWRQVHERAQKLHNRKMSSSHNKHDIPRNKAVTGYILTQLLLWRRKIVTIGLIIQETDFHSNA